MSAPRALVVRLEHGRANALDGALLAVLGGHLDRAEAEARPLVLTGSGRFFSAGLDLVGLPESREEMGEFVDAFEGLLLRLFAFPLPVVAAVNGHAVAGGAILAAAADVRIGAEGDYRVGVSEVSLGVVFPAAAFEIVRAAVPPQRRPEVLLRGRLTGPAEAVGNGFLHELAPPESLLGAATERAEELGGRPREAFAHTKRELRSDALRAAAVRRPETRELFLDSWFSEAAKERRAAVLSARGKSPRPSPSRP